MSKTVSGLGSGSGSGLGSDSWLGSGSWSGSGSRLGSGSGSYPRSQREPGDKRTDLALN